ncbi:WD repeat-containing protein 63 [Cricetulus griseus]|uniref:WD repeat-containing protein 63 n=1 Tax=Cricetulus griseus TaxID=10029 RepID=G3IET1_CRIGR|nr:WD repeat-containing protein 63 [Cricetulus griseus]
MSKFHFVFTGHPEIYPLVLTTKTQEIFNCRIDEDFTDEQSYKFIKKDDILADLLNRAAVSDFHPVKKIVREYPGEELVLVYDKDFKYGLNFYLIGTEEGKENFLKSLEETEEPEELKEHIPEDVYVYKPPMSKPWVSLGSEKEIEEESVKESKRRVTYMISRKRSKFGAPVTFRDHNASSVKDVYIECASYVDKNFVLTQVEKDMGLQVIPEVTDISTQTKCVEIALQQNEIMNTFIDDWKNLAEEESTFGDKSDTHLKEYQSFTDLHSTMEKMVTCVAWHPTIYGLIVVSVAVRLSYEERVQFSGKLLLQPSLILFWSFSDPIHPQLMLESPDDIFCFEFCPSDPNIIAGGCINGQVVLWDITSHADRIENIKAGSSRSKKATLKINRMGCVFENRSGINCQLVTCSADCTICFWDIRPQKPGSGATTTTNTTTTEENSQPPPTPGAEKKKEETIEIPFDVPSTFLHLDLSWKPQSRIRLSKGETSLDHCPTKLSLGEDPLLCRMQGTSSMHVLLKEKVLSQIRALKTAEINPYHNLEAGLANILKPIDDFSTKFFVGTETGPLLQTCCAPKRYTAGHWSLTRPGVFYIGREDGYVDIWDLLEKTHEPAQSQNICITMITYIKPWTFSSKQQFIAIADYYGTLHILEIPWTLSRPSFNEVSSVNYYFEREVKHLDYVQQRKLIREEEKREIALELAKKKAKVYHMTKEQIEAELKLEYDGYLELEKSVLFSLGLSKVPEKVSYLDML